MKKKIKKKKKKGKGKKITTLFRVVLIGHKLATTAPAACSQLDPFLF